MDRTTDRACSGKRAKSETGKPNGCGSDPSHSPPKGENHCKNTGRLNAVEWLAVFIVGAVTLWGVGLPAANPLDWFNWLFGMEGRGTTNAKTLIVFLALIFLLVNRAVWKYKRQSPGNFFPGAEEVRGLSIVEFSPESSARDVGMHRRDVIIDYAAERDLTIEKLSDVIERTATENGLVRVVFMRGRQQYAEVLPSGPLGISAINTTVSVPIKSN